MPLLTRQQSRNQHVEEAVSSLLSNEEKQQLRDIFRLQRPEKSDIGNEPLLKGLVKKGLVRERSGTWQLTDAGLRALESESA